MKYVSTAAQKFVHVLEGEHGRVYVGLAKTGLWMCSLTLTFVIVGGLIAAARGNTETIGNVVQACQVLAMVAIAVLGYHGYSGTRIFHALRHWTEGRPDKEDSQP